MLLLFLPALSPALDNNSLSTFEDVWQFVLEVDEGGQAGHTEVVGGRRVGDLHEVDAVHVAVVVDRLQGLQGCLHGGGLGVIWTKMIDEYLHVGRLDLLTKKYSDVLHRRDHGLEGGELHLLDHVLLVPAVPVLDQPLQHVVLRPEVPCGQTVLL